MDYFSSNSMILMEKSMNYLWTKQAAISDNIANAETPGYKAKLVTFEDNLREKLEQALRSNAPRRNTRQVLSEAEISVIRRAPAWMITVSMSPSRWWNLCATPTSCST